MSSTASSKSESPRNQRNAKNPPAASPITRARITSIFIGLHSFVPGLQPGNLQPRRTPLRQRSCKYKTSALRPCYPSALRHRRGADAVVLRLRQRERRNERFLRGGRGDTDNGADIAFAELN